jgi:hypothetical protein
MTCKQGGHWCSRLVAAVQTCKVPADVGLVVGWLRMQLFAAALLYTLAVVQYDQPSGMEKQQVVLATD